MVEPEKFISYLRGYAQEINSAFEKIRSSHKDTNVKGSENEKIVAEFIKLHVPNWNTYTKTEIVDLKNWSSDEVDICVCNNYQLSNIEGGLLIAEGVDFVVQVKAIITDKELDRAIKNCQTVKKLERQFQKHDQVICPERMKPNDLSRIPYTVFAFSSSLKSETLHERINSKSSCISSSEQIDAIFILDRGLSYINCREGETNWIDLRGPIVGWLQMESGDNTLVELLRFLHTRVPRFLRMSSPLTKYFPVFPTCKHKTLS